MTLNVASKTCVGCGLSIQVGVARHHRVPRAVPIPRPVFSSACDLRHHSSACSFKKRTSSGLVGFTSMPRRSARNKAKLAP
jgi:hypothetical protein